MSLTLEQIEFLATPQGAELLSMDLPANELAAQRALRKRCRPEEAIAVIVTRAMRTKAARQRKFPTSISGRLLGTDKLFQQASSAAIGEHVARTLAGFCSGPPTIYDLCCGMGGSCIGMALADEQYRIIAVDSDPVALRCAAHNAASAGVAERCQFVPADVTSVDIPADAVLHIDPDRRSGGRRHVAMSDYLPGEEFLLRLRRGTRAGVIKLSSMLGTQELEAFAPIRLEYVSLGGTVRQLLAWWAPTIIEPISTSATVIEEQDGRCVRVCSIGPSGDEPNTGPLGEYLVEPDGAVIAAHLVDELATRDGLRRFDPRIVWLTGDALPPPDSLYRTFRILQEVPGRRKDIARALRGLDAGVVVVKPRGVQIDTDMMQKAFRGKGSRTLVVFWFRQGPHEKALIAETEA